MDYKKILLAILPSIIIISLFFIFFPRNKDSRDELKALKHQNDSLKTANDSIFALEKNYEMRASAVDDVIGKFKEMQNSYDKEVADLSDSIKRLKKVYVIAASHADNFSSTQIQKYYADSLADNVIASKDSSAIPNSQLRKAIDIIEVGRLTEQELSVTQLKVIKMDSSIKARDNIILNYRAKDTIQQAEISGYKAAVVNLQKTAGNNQEMFSIEKKKLNKERAKKWLTLILGVGAGYLIFH